MCKCIKHIALRWKQFFLLLFISLTPQAWAIEENAERFSPQHPYKIHAETFAEQLERIKKDRISDISYEGPMDEGYLSQLAYCFHPGSMDRKYNSDPHRPLVLKSLRLLKTNPAIPLPLEYIIDTFSSHKELTSLDLSKNQIGDSSVASLTRWTNLKSLNLADNERL